jgi:hypothetical protein
VETRFGLTSKTEAGESYSAVFEHVMICAMPALGGGWGRATAGGSCLCSLTGSSGCSRSLETASRCLRSGT